MARCDRGYLCSVCGKAVELLTESELYLRYVLGEVGWEELDRARDRHLGCNPALSQFIVSEGYVTPEVAGAFSKRGLDGEFVAMEEARVTRGYERLVEIAGSGGVIWEYPARGDDGTVSTGEPG